MQRKKTVLLATEYALLATAAELAIRGVAEFHGFQLAKAKSEAEGAPVLSQGGLYKALDRLYKAGYFGSRWEDQATAIKEGRPPRRLYWLAAEGRRALREVPIDPAGAVQP